MLSKSSKWELGLVHYIAKFTILRFVISRFECTYFVPTTIEHEALPDLRLNWASISSKVDLSVNENTYTIAEAFCLQTCNKSCNIK